MIEVIQIPVLRDNYTYILIDKESNQTACVDPSESKIVVQELRKKRLNLNFILNTHHHSDHTGGNIALKEIYKCKVIGSEKDKKRIPGIDIYLNDKDVYFLGKSKFIVYDVPGHTTGHICFFFMKEMFLFCGDTLFSMGCGRIFEGTHQQMWNSLQKIRALPDSTLIYCGHEYTQSNIKFAISLEPKNSQLEEKYQEILFKRKNNKPTVPSKLSEEKKLNPFLRADDKVLMENLNLREKTSLEVFSQIRAQKDIF